MPDTLHLNQLRAFSLIGLMVLAGLGCGAEGEPHSEVLEATEQSVAVRHLLAAKEPEGPSETDHKQHWRGTGVDFEFMGSILKTDVCYRDPQLFYGCFLSLRFLLEASNHDHKLHLSERKPKDSGEVLKKWGRLYITELSQFDLNGKLSGDQIGSLQTI